MPLRSPRRASLLLATGQTTQYSSEPDDGYYQRGIPKRYEVLTTGPYAGDSSIDVPRARAALQRAQNRIRIYKELH